MSILEYDLLFPMDVDKKKLHIAIMDDERLIRRVGIPNDAENLLAFVRKQFPQKKVLFAYEAGPTGYVLYDFLTEHGEACKVAVPSMIPKAPGQRVKTNRLDAYKLGVQVRTGDLSFVHVPEKKYRDLRHLVRLRQTYRKRTIGVKNALKGLFLFEGITFPDGRWSKQLVRELEQTSHRPAVEFKIQRLLLDLQYFQAQELKTKAQIRRFCRADEEINRCIVHMMTVPGVGWIVSTYVLAALGGYKHLSSIKSTTGFVGLGPRENSTGDKVRRGEITAVGDPNVRKMIVQGAWVGIRKDPELRLTFDKVFYRNPIQYASKKAIIAVSRKMVGWMHVVLRDQRPFENRLKKTA